MLGCGPIAQFAHFESCTKAGNADLYAICDVGARSARSAWAPTYGRRRCLPTMTPCSPIPELEAVIVATSDAFHVPASITALEAGKHVLCEKPIGTSVEEGEALARRSKRRARCCRSGT